MSDKEKPTLEQLKQSAQSARLSAERAWYAYACEADIGPDREYAFEVYEQIRAANRRFQ